MKFISIKKTILIQRRTPPAPPSTATEIPWQDPMRLTAMAQVRLTTRPGCSRINNMEVKTECKSIKSN